jgi:uncharacterized protein (DUF1810 family)
MILHQEPGQQNNDDTEITALSNTNRDLERFREIPEQIYQAAREELENGQKVSHWMWFVFPQAAGLGLSEMSRKYAIASPAEATAFLADTELGGRLISNVELLVNLRFGSADSVFGPVDAAKFKSCLTLFTLADGKADNVFDTALQIYFAGERDMETVEIWKSWTVRQQ